MNMADMNFNFTLPEESTPELDEDFARWNSVPYEKVQPYEQLIGKRIRLERKDYPTDEEFVVENYFMKAETFELLGLEIKSLADPRVKMSVPKEFCVFPED